MKNVSFKSEFQNNDDLSYYIRAEMSCVLGRNFEARTTKFCMHVDEHRVMRPIDFHNHWLIASYILMTIKLYILG